MQAPNKKHEIEDNTMQMGLLLWKLHAGYALPFFWKHCTGRPQELITMLCMYDRDVSEGVVLSCCS